jgi:membrane protease YdiL (CAAX protease family)
MLTVPEGGSELPLEARRPRARWLIAGAAVLFFLVMVGLVMGGELGLFVSQSVRVLPFVPLAVLSYYGAHYRWARGAALVWLTALVLAMTVLSFVAVIGTLGPDAMSLEEEWTLPEQWKIVSTAIGMLLASAVGLLGLFKPVRRWAARLLPLDPDSFVHTVALVTVVTMTLQSFVPLVVMGGPTLIAFMSGLLEGGTELDLGGGGETLRGELYGLVWMVIGSLFAVGWVVKRTLREALRRLGLVRPTASQVGLGVALGLGLVIVVAVFNVGIGWLWERMGWSTSGGGGFDEVFNTLLGPFLTPIGAVVLGLSAGLGEELAVRGVLQPRLGILLSNLLFTGLHAFQYNWDALLVVFLLGVVLGLIRRRTNTTTSVIVHGVYDFALVLAMVSQAPLIGE